VWTIRSNPIACQTSSLAYIYTFKMSAPLVFVWYTKDIAESSNCCIGLLQTECHSRAHNCFGVGLPFPCCQIFPIFYRACKSSSSLNILGATSNECREVYIQQRGLGKRCNLPQLVPSRQTIFCALWARKCF